MKNIDVIIWIKENIIDPEIVWSKHRLNYEDWDLTWDMQPTGSDRTYAFALTKPNTIDGFLFVKNGNNIIVNYKMKPYKYDSLVADYYSMDETQFSLSYFRIIEENISKDTLELIESHGFT